MPGKPRRKRLSPVIAGSVLVMVAALVGQGVAGCAENPAPSAPKRDGQTAADLFMLGEAELRRDRSAVIRDAAADLPAGLDHATGDLAPLIDLRVQSDLSGLDHATSDLDPLVDSRVQSDLSATDMAGDAWPCGELGTCGPPSIIFSSSFSGVQICDEDQQCASAPLGSSYYECTDIAVHLTGVDSVTGFSWPSWGGAGGDLPGDGARNYFNDVIKNAAPDCCASGCLATDLAACHRLEIISTTQHRRDRGRGAVAAAAQGLLGQFLLAAPVQPLRRGSARRAGSAGLLVLLL